MATKIRRCLFIGLGGTGMTALLHTKKAFVDTYGEVPPMIGFLGLDTDGGAYKKYLTSSQGPITLDPNEQMAISVESAYDIYQVQKQHFDWVPEETKFALSNLSDSGAGQIRANGRFSLINNIGDVETRIKQKLGDITNASIALDGKYQLLSDKVEIHMVFSLCGGTGAGTFIDTAYLVRRMTDYKSKVAGYAVLPDVFWEMRNAGMERVKPNAYGALLELDRLMHFGMSDDDVLEFNYAGRRVTITRRPFNAVFIIDNKNKSKDTVRDVDLLAEMISSALTTAAGELSAAAASTLDNIEQTIAQRSYEIGNKAGWVSSLGASEIVFKGKTLAKIFALKSAQRIIQRLMNTCEDANNIANAWIDSPEVNIRENNGSENDNVIDFILAEKSPNIPLTGINNQQNAEPEVNVYLDTIAQPKAAELDARRVELEKRVSKELTKLVTRTLNSECGVGKTKDVLDELTTIVNLFLKEMVNEKKTFNERLPQMTNAIKVCSDELAEASNKIWSALFKARVQACEESLLLAVAEKAVALREVARREQAITFFNGLLNRISDERLKVDNIDRQLRAVNDMLRTEIAGIQNNIKGTSDLFRIDLAKELALGINADDSTLSIADFVRASGGDIVNNFASLSAEEIKDKLLNYTRNLPEAKRWAARTVDQVLTDMYNEDKEKFRLVLTRALHKSSPMLQENPRGHAFKDGQKIADHYYIGVEDKDNSIIKNSGMINNLEAGVTDAGIASVGMPDRIIFYHQRGVMPAFFIGPLLSYREAYLNNPGLYHIDEKLRRKMDREDYSIMPAAEIDDSVELWVKGLIFGKIRKTENGYEHQNEVDGEPFMDYWMPLAECRDDAFDAFKRNLTTIRNSYTTYFEQEIARRGEDNVKELIADIKANYRDKYSQCTLTNADLMKKGNEAVRTLINNELIYVKNL